MQDFIPDSQQICGVGVKNPILQKRKLSRRTFQSLARVSLSDRRACAPNAVVHRRLLKVFGIGGPLTGDRVSGWGVVQSG